MRTLRVPVRVVFYREEGRIVAHSLEFDLLGDGDTHEQAITNLFEAIALQVQESSRLKNRANLFNPAEAHVFEMFAAGKEHFVGELKIRLTEPDSCVKLEDVQARDFIPENDDALACV